MLKSDIIWPESRRYKSRTEWEPVGFFSDVLCNSTQFDIKLGFFSSSAINILSDGFAAFLYNGGRMRLVINDILSEEDKLAIVAGQSPETLVSTFDLDNLESIKNVLSDRNRHFFDCLAWLIKNNRLEFKIIKPNDSDGISHCKVGLFSDGVNKVAFDGSCNFSRKALIENRESISVFCDWDGRSDANRVKDIENEFEVTISEKDDSVTYVDASNVRTRLNTVFGDKDINQLLEEEETLITKHLADDLPVSVQLSLSKTKRRVRSIIDKINSKQPTSTPTEENAPAFPYGEPHDYQKKAYNKWKQSQKGLFAMATGTGKTATSLYCLLHIYNKYQYYKAMILVPTITLVDQWEQECRKFHFDNVIKVNSQNPNWRNELDAVKAKEQFGFAGIETSFIIIATYASFSRENIFHELMDFPKKTTMQMLLIADEAHNMGSGRILDRLGGVKISRRIGLSATPERQFDDKGNAAIMKFFGCEDNYTFEFPMQEAIDKGYLCRYYYYPHLVSLTDAELDEYEKISLKLAKFYTNDSFPDADEILMRLLLKRKRIIHKAANKADVFKTIIEERYKEQGNLKYTLVYVPEGLEPDDRRADIFDTKESLPNDDETDHIIDLFTQIVKDVSPTTTVKKFVTGIQGRNSILDDFAQGNLEVLTSMKCLDEGVDVPRSELAIFCASTGNPRQFIQRRGRILRKHPEKHYAIIHDLVVAPMVQYDISSYNMERNLLKGELRRVKDFAEMSENADFAYTELEDILNYYNLSIF